MIDALEVKTKKTYDSWGNGSAMRVSPVGWAFDNLEDVLKEAKKSALYIRKLKPEYPLGYVLIGQSTFYNKNAEYTEIRDTLNIV